MGRRERASSARTTGGKTKAKQVRKELLSAISSVLTQVEASSKGTKADPAAAKAYAEAASALMSTDLAHELIVGPDGLGGSKDGD